MSSANLIKSFLLGLVVGLALQLLATGDVSIGDRVLTLAGCGAVGLAIGIATEWLTSLVPLRHARAGTYFAVNGLIAVLVTAAATATIVAVIGNPDPAEWWLVVGTAAGIVAVANAVDLFVHLRSQRRLREAQAALARGGAAADED